MMHSNCFRFCSVLFLLLTLLPGCDGSPGASRQGDPGGGERAAAFRLPDLEGGEVELLDFAGQVVVLNFWATWCGPCRMEIPHLVNLYAKYRVNGLAVIGIALDSEGPEVLLEFTRQMGINYPVLVGNDRVADDYGGILGIPTTLLIARDGTIRTRYVGLADEGALEGEIVSLLRN